MTTAPQLPADTTGTATVDAQLHGRNLRSAAVIAGILDAALLDHVGQPSKLPTALFPDVDPDTVQAIWNMGVAVGIRGGKVLLAPQWDPSALDRLQRALDEVGYTAMAGSVATAAGCGRRHHPADNELLLWGDEQ